MGPERSCTSPPTIYERVGFPLALAGTPLSLSKPRNERTVALMLLTHGTNGDKPLSDQGPVLGVGR
jgi:hypothetical protein